MTKLFISHRSTDKALADLFVDFLLRCGIRSEDILCSSLPGNDIKANIPIEIKTCLMASVINIVLLSADYYKSSYCLNEEGIIWFLNTPKIIICLPEIDERLMEGFLNSDNKIRRLHHESDLLAITDIIKPLFSDFINSAAKLNANISKLIQEYTSALKSRRISIPEETPPRINELEDDILSDKYLDEELVALRYMYDNRTDIFYKDTDSPFSEWLNEHKTSIASKINIAEYFVDSDIATTIQSDDWNDTYVVQLSPSIYRNLMKLSMKALSYMDLAISRLTLEEKQRSVEIPSQNEMDKLVSNGFNDFEMLFLKYAMDTGRVKFMCGWQLEQELQVIRAWEDVNTIRKTLSTNYIPTMSRLLLRNIINVSQVTSYNNPKEYEISKDSLRLLDNITQNSRQKLDSIIDKYRINIFDAELPY